MVLGTLYRHWPRLAPQGGVRRPAMLVYARQGALELVVSAYCREVGIFVRPKLALYEVNQLE